MPEPRLDAITGRLVIEVATRSARPHTVPPAPSDTGGPAPDCPFCPGNETMTPPETYRTGGEAAEEWRLRVVPNLYPITDAHEVIILSPDHDADLGGLDPAAATEVLTVMRDRVRYHLGQGRAYVQAFINNGRAAGASIAHPHAQIVALDAVPPAVDEMTARFDTDLVARELANARRDDLVVVDGPAPAWAPPVSGTSYGLRVAHRSTRARFDEATDAEIGVVARALRDALARINALLGAPAYNVVVHSAPPGRSAGEFHWHVEVLPRTGVVAGFEIGTGILVNTVTSADAAAALRDVEPAPAVAS